MGDDSRMIRSLRPLLRRLTASLACAAFLAPLAIQAQKTKEKEPPGRSKAVQAQIKAAEVPLKAANTLRDAGQFEPAIEKYTEVIKVAPELFQGYANRGFTRIELGVMKREMRNDPAAQTQADELFKAGTEDYEMAMKLAPKDKAVVLRNDRANALTRAGNYEVAFADFEFLMKEDPKNLKAYFFNRGVAYLDKATALRDKVRTEKKSLDAGVAAAKPDFTLAMADFTKTIELDPKMTASYLNRGTCNTRILEYELAVVDYTKAIEIDPANKRAYRSRGEVNKALAEGLRQLGDKDKAAELKAASDRDFAKYEELTKLPAGAAGGTALPVAPVNAATPAAPAATPATPVPAASPTPAKTP